MTASAQGAAGCTREGDLARLAIFRADASADIGTGHVQRCLTIARLLAINGWTVGFAVTAATVQAVPALADPKFGKLIVGGRPDAEIELMKRQWPRGSDLLVVDHYQRNADFETRARGWARRIAAIDDLPSRAHDVDLLIDATAGRTANDYAGHVPAAAKVLAGVEYVMLRSEVVGARRPMGPAPATATQLFVSFGGSDPDDLTSRAIDALDDDRLRAVQATVVVGPANEKADAIAKRARPNLRVVVDPPRLAEVMAGSDFALAGSGTMAWELAYLGVPSLLAVHSRGTVVEALTAAGAARPLGRADDLSPEIIANAAAALAKDRETRAAMAAAGRALIDGRGAARVANALEELVR